MRYYKQSGRAGFTLLEIMLVVMIIGLLLTVAVIRIGPQAEKARITAAKQQIGNFSSSVNLFLLDVSRYPATDEGLESLLRSPGETGWRGPYLEKLEVPNDPWGSKYIYKYPGDKNPSGPDISSPGPDRVPGNDDDIGNWQ
jgi:general secretion pathway protein G